MKKSISVGNYTINATGETVAATVIIDNEKLIHLIVRAAKSKAKTSRLPE